MHATTVRGTRYAFADLKTLMARATPPRSGDRLAGVAAENATERVAAQMTLADLPLAAFLREALVPYEDDEVTRAILDTHDVQAFAPVATSRSASCATGCCRTKRRARRWRRCRPG